MFNGNIVGNIDVASIAFWAFVLFLIGLIYYLRREDRREGFPLEDELTGRSLGMGGPLLHASPKSFKLPFGRGTVYTPTIGKEPFNIAARKAGPGAGDPYIPTGNPLADCIGPSAYAERSRLPDIDAFGNNRIVPMALEPSFSIARGDPDPRGMTVIGADGAVAGTVAEIWVDRSEHQVRYLEVVTAEGVHALAPMPMAKIRRSARQIVVDAINAAQFAGCPQVETAGQISRYEEDKISGYFGGGYLYANAARQEPLI